jgi:hypothetical protein
MKRAAILLAGAAALCAAVPASAQVRRIDSVVLLCTPPIDFREADPIVRTYVAFNADQTTVEAMSINHEARSGVRYDRFQQYDFKVGVFDGMYGWTGVYLNKASVIMSGAAYVATDGLWYYRERLWENGIAKWDHTIPCSVIKHEVRP